MKAYRRAEVELQSFFTSALDGGEWLISRLDDFSLSAPLSTEWEAGRAAEPFWTFEEQKNLLPPSGF
jgi:hypothetical protein